MILWFLNCYYNIKLKESFLLSGMENINKTAAAAEALLFVYGEPMEIKKISEILRISEDETKTALNHLSQELQSDSRGLLVSFSGTRAQIITKPEFFSSIEGLVKDEYEENITPAALETLSLVAYLGPIPRSQIDYFRGVNSTYTLRNLLMRGLVERVSDQSRSASDGEARPFGRPHMPFYQASFDLLKHLGLSNIEELPDYEKFKEIIAKSVETDQVNPQNESASL